MPSGHSLTMWERIDANAVMDYAQEYALHYFGIDTTGAKRICHNESEDSPHAGVRWPRAPVLDVRIHALGLAPQGRGARKGEGIPVESTGGGAPLRREGWYTGRPVHL